MTTVLDASALLAYLQDEPGGEVVADILPDAVMSSVNWAEVIQKCVAAGVGIEGLGDDLKLLGLRIEPLTEKDAEVVGQLWQQTRNFGLSLGDRACLSLGLKLKAPVLTADQAWQQLNLGIAVQTIR